MIAASGAFAAQLHRRGRYRDQILASTATAAAAALAQQPRSSASSTGAIGETYFRPLCDGDVLQASSGQRIVVGTTLSMLALGYARAAWMLATGSAGGVLVAAGCV